MCVYCLGFYIQIDVFNECDDAMWLQCLYTLQLLTKALLLPAAAAHSQTVSVLQRLVRTCLKQALTALDQVNLAVLSSFIHAELIHAGDSFLTAMYELFPVAREGGRWANKLYTQWEQATAATANSRDPQLRMSQGPCPIKKELCGQFEGWTRKATDVKVKLDHGHEVADDLPDLEHDSDEASENSDVKRSHVQSPEAYADMSKEELIQALQSSKSEKEKEKEIEIGVGEVRKKFQRVAIESSDSSDDTEDESEEEMDQLD